jgi:hypothetical protein
VKIPLYLGPHDDSALLEEVPINIRTGDASIGCKANPYKLAETTRVVILGGLGITEGFKDRIRLKDLLLEQAKLALDDRRSGASRRRGGPVFERRAAWEAGRGLRGPKGGTCGRVCRGSLSVAVRRNCRKVLDDLLRILRLSRARFTTVPRCQYGQGRQVAGGRT